MADPTVADIMRRDVPVVAPTDSIAVVARLMADNGLPGLPVVDDDELVGIVTEADIVSREADVAVPTVVPFFDAIVVADAGRPFDDDLRRVLAVTAGDLMTSPVYNIRASASLTELATLMLERRVNPVPVVDDDDLTLVGIVSRADLVRIVATLEAASDSSDNA
jgi:CBS domain-containing protein